MKNTTNRSLLSVTLRRQYAPGDTLPSASEIAALPEWDAVRGAWDRGEFQVAEVVSPKSSASVDPVFPAEVPLPVKDSTLPIPRPARKGRRKTAKM